MRGRGTLVAAFTAAVGLFMAPGAFAATAPSYLSSQSNGTSLSGDDAVAVSGSFAYTTAYFTGDLTAVDISNPAAPVIDGSAAGPAAGPSPETVSTNASGVTVAGGYAYVSSKNRNGTTTNADDGSGNSLSIFNIAGANQTAPAYVGSVSDASASSSCASASCLFGAYESAISGTHAFVAAQGCLSGQPCPNASISGSFDVIDISNPASPTITATLANSSLSGADANALHHIDSVAISGSYAYVTAFYQPYALTVINISNPASPTIAATLTNPNMTNPNSVAINGNYAYVVDQTNPGRLFVISISNPALPSVVGSISSSLLNGAYRVRVRGNLAYVAATNGSVIAVDVSDPSAPRIAGSITDTTHLNSATGIALDSTGAYALAASPLQSGQTNPLYPPIPPQPGAPANAGTLAVIQLDPTPIGVTIAPSSEPPPVTTSATANFSFATTDDVSTVACSLDGASYGLCTSPTTQAYTGLGAGPHTFSVRATDSAGTTSTASYSWTIQAPPSNLALPTITGTAFQGEVLTEHNGSWAGSPTGYTYQWEDCDSSGASCAPITGATSQNYTLAAGDVGHTIVVQETASNGAGHSSPASSTATPVVLPLPPANTTPPTISGSAVQGQVLTENHGAWANSPTSYAYQWEDCDSSGNNCSAITGATQQTYTLGAGDVGQTIVVQERATNAGGAFATASSAATAVVAAPPPVIRFAPRISGAPVVGKTLSATSGAWTSTTPLTYRYQWQLCRPTCSNIAGATTASLTLAAADVNGKVRVVVTARNTNGTASSPSSEVGPVTGLGPTPAQVRAALSKVLIPRGRGATLAAILKAGSFSFSFAAPGAGTLTITWTTTVKGKAAVVASARVVVRRRQAVRAQVRLTRRGRALLEGAGSPRLTVTASFSPRGEGATAMTRQFALKR